MSNNKEIRWLHISDLHIGSPKNKWLDNTIQEKFIEIISHIGRIDFILISGDIIHQGQYNNHELYNKAKNFLLELKKISKHLVFAIGNHDYTRDDTRYTILKKWRNETNKENKEDEYLNKVTSSFMKFVSFCKEISSTENPISPNSYVYDKYEDLNIVVLNTSAFSGQPVCDEKGDFKRDSNNRIIVDDLKKIWLCDAELPNYSLLNNSIPTIVVGHHSLGMFSEESKQKLLSFLKNINTKYYFCGHIHQNSKIDMDTIHQCATAGLFKDDDNIPSFKLYEMQKNSNTNIHERLYVYNNNIGAWKNTDLNQNIYEEIIETTDNSSDIIPFYLEKSNISSGALRLPYGDGGAFNIYISKSKLTDLISPHSHQNIDEVTYIIKGSAYACIDKQVTVLNAYEAIPMPKGTLHSIIPKTFPCEYLTMGIESKTETYRERWDKDITQLKELKNMLYSNDDVLQTGNNIINQLKSNILEVRWTAIEIIKQFLSNDADENIESKSIVASQLQLFVSKLLKASDLQENITALNIAYEFSVKISPRKISEILITDKHFLLPWVCMYYLLKTKLKKVDFACLYEKNIKQSNKSKEIKYYECAYLSLLELLINKNDNLLTEFYKSEFSDLNSEIPLKAIVIHFFVWYICNCLQGVVTNYSRLSEKYTVREILDVENVIRTLLDIQNSDGIFKLLQDNFEIDKLLIIVSEYMKCIEESKNDILIQQTTKDNIKQYLRIIVSEKCNLNCVYCHHEGRTKTLIGEEIQDNPNFDLQKLLEEAKKSQFKKIKISGGEPLLYPNILQICKAFENDFVDIGFTTNGTQICSLKDEFDRIGKSKLTFNVTLNTVDKYKYQQITKSDCLERVMNGIDFLIRKGFKVKLNAVITSFNFNDIESLVAYAARMRINIKLLDLFTVGSQFEEFQRVSIVEIKNRLMTLYRINENDFFQQNDYLCAKIMGTQVLIPQRVYCKDCQYNCPMYPCAEGLFGIRVYEDYSCARCFRGDIYTGDITSFSKNVEDIRHSLDTICLSY